MILSPNKKSHPSINSEVDLLVVIKEKSKYSKGPRLYCNSSENFLKKSSFNPFFFKKIARLLVRSTPLLVNKTILSISGNRFFFFLHKKTTMKIHTPRRKVILRPGLLRHWN